jgi:LCP family protein required for cell wall assembly
MANKNNNHSGNSRFEDVSSFSSDSAYRKTQNAKKGRHKGLKIFISIVCILLIVSGSVVLYASNFVFGGLTTNTITKDKNELGIQSTAVSDDSVTNIALFGLDSRGDNFEGRSDVMIILTLDGKHRKVKMTSILRDIRVKMPDDYNLTDDGYDKLNHAYSFGGPTYAIKELNQVFNLNITNYVTVNFYKMAEIVDAFGGVDVEVSDEEVTYINKNLYDLNNEDPSIGITEAEYLDTSGLVHLDGNQAVAYARIRKLDTDNMRAARQQTVMKALMEKAKNMSATEYPALINKISSLCETSLDLTTMLSYVPFIMQGFTVESLILPSDVEGYDWGYFDDGQWMWCYDTDLAAAHIEDFIYEDGALDKYTGSTTSSDGN